MALPAADYQQLTRPQSLPYSWLGFLVPFSSQVVDALVSPVSGPALRPLQYLAAKPLPPFSTVCLSLKLYLSLRELHNPAVFIPCHFLSPIHCRKQQVLSQQGDPVSTLWGGSHHACGFYIRPMSFTAGTWADPPSLIILGAANSQGRSDGGSVVPSPVIVHCSSELTKLVIAQPNRRECDRCVVYWWIVQKFMGVDRQHEKPT